MRGEQAAWLDQEEATRAERFVSPRDRQRYVAAHAALRRVLGLYLGTDPGAVPLGRDEAGKPFVQDAPGLAFSFAHSADRVAIAVSGGVAVGVDIEIARGRLSPLRIARRFFAPEEARMLEGLRGRARDAAFYRCWTRKEAYGKARGGGLRDGLRARLCAGAVAQPITLLDLPPLDGCHGAVAALAPGCTVAFYLLAPAG